MAKIPGEVKEMFKNQLPLIATASKGGIPNVGPKGSMCVVDDETIAYSEGTRRTTLKNIKENPNVSIIVVDREKLDGYQLKGNAEVVTSGGVYEEVAKRQEARNRPRPEFVVKINVKEVYTLKPGVADHKIA